MLQEEIAAPSSTRKQPIIGVGRLHLHRSLSAQNFLAGSFAREVARCVTETKVAAGLITLLAVLLRHRTVSALQGFHLGHIATDPCPPKGFGAGAVVESGRLIGPHFDVGLHDSGLLWLRREQLRQRLPIDRRGKNEQGYEEEDKDREKQQIRTLRHGPPDHRRNLLANVSLTLEATRARFCSPRIGNVKRVCLFRTRHCAA